MEQSFLQIVAAHLVHAQRERMADVWVIVPGNRAGYRLKKEIAAIAGTTWAPQTMTFPQLIQRLCAEGLGSNMELTLGLYDCIRKMDEHTETPENFLEWAPMLLSDFNDIDQHLLNANQVFRNLREYTEIDNWSFLSEQLSPQQEQLSDFWLKAGIWYTTFNQWQEEHELFNYGTLIRKLCANKEKFTAGINRPLYFVGLHALTPAEEEVMRFFEKHLDAQVYFDADEYYVDNHEHEAGMLLRRLFTGRKSVKWISRHLATDPMKISVYKSSTAIGQSFGVAQQLLNDQGAKRSTVVVLNDESMSDSLDTALRTVGLRMNYRGNSATQSRLFSFLDLWLSILVQQESKNKDRWRVADLLQLLLHPVLENVAHQHAHAMTQYFQEHNIVVTDRKDLESFSRVSNSAEWIEILFPQKIRAKEFAGHIQAVLKKLYGTAGVRAGLHEEILQFHGWTGEIHSMIFGREYINNVRTVRKLFRMFLSGKKMDDTTRGPKDVEVMGLLETRAMDFDRVIMLSCNEGKLPQTNSYNSFIPFDIRKAYKMPLQQERESLYAYNFYRVLQRATFVDLYYSSSQEDFAYTEPSRFIAQIQHELVKVNNRIELTRKNLQISQPPEKTAQLRIQDPYIKKRLIDLFTSGLSPSAINTFIRCPKDFYYQYVIGLAEKEVAEETISASVFGSIVHRVLENFYSNYIGSFPSKKEMEEFRNDVEEWVQKCQCEKEFALYRWNGENQLALEIAKKMLLKFAGYELENYRKGVSIVGLEMLLEGNIPVSNIPGIDHVKIRGKADRVERQEEMIRIIDYKTGAVDQSELNYPEEISHLFTRPAKSKLLQLLIYQHCYRQMNESESLNIMPAIFSMRSFSSGFMYPGKYGGEKADFHQLFIHEMNLLFQRMYHCEEFEHNAQSKFCEYC